MDNGGTEGTRQKKKKKKSIAAPLTSIAHGVLVLIQFQNPHNHVARLTHNGSQMVHDVAVYKPITEHGYDENLITYLFLSTQKAAAVSERLLKSYE